MADNKRPYTPDAAELWLALDVLIERLPDLMEPDKYGFSHKAKTWVDGLEKDLRYVQGKIAEDAQ